MTNEKILEEFESLYEDLKEILDRPVCCTKEDCFCNKDTVWEHLKSFLSDKLDQSRAEEREMIVKEIEKVRFGYEPPYVGDCYEEMKGEWRGIVKVLNELLTSLQDKPKCVCGYQDILDGAEVEIGGVCHRPKNPCYIIEPLKNK